MMHRLAALTALVLWLTAIGLMTFVTIVDFYRGAAGLLIVVLALWSAGRGLVRRRIVRVVALVAGALLAVIAVALLIAVRPAVVLTAIGALGAGVAAGAYALRAPVPLPRVPAPTHPVLFWNRRSGGGKAVQAALPDEARARGITPIELVPGRDFAEQMVDAVNADVDAIAVAGGDGSQAMGARLAAERGLPFACIPAGTRNHFALDLGVDRNDVVGALDAFVEGGERVVDLADVNGHVFVNNVSIGLYGEAVQQAGYRDAKIRTLVETVPVVLSPGARPHLQWRSPDGHEHDGAVAMLVSNNPYQLGRGIGDGTRPRLDTGLLGVTVLGVPGDEPGAWVWSTSSFDVDARRAVNVGVDGEALVLEPPLCFRMRPATLRCRIARHHPGASPSAFELGGAAALIVRLVRIAAVS
jgi:diacylglycerol kinase family enzyme